MVAEIMLKILLTALSNLTSLYKQIECTHTCIQNYMHIQARIQDTQRLHTHTQDYTHINTTHKHYTHTTWHTHTHTHNSTHKTTCMNVHEHTYANASTNTPVYFSNVYIYDIYHFEWFGSVGNK